MFLPLFEKFPDEVTYFGCLENKNWFKSKIKFQNFLLTADVEQLQAHTTKQKRMETSKKRIKFTLHPAPIGTIIEVGSEHESTVNNKVQSDIINSCERLNKR
jgi:hypothetical protein